MPELIVPDQVNPGDIQGLVHGFGHKWPHARFYFLQLPDPDPGPELARFFVQQLDPIASYADLLEMGVSPPESVISCAFTYQGLKKVGLSEVTLDKLPDVFIQGMAVRARDKLGDRGLSDSDNWDEIWRLDAIDMWLGVYTSHPDSVVYDQVERLIDENTTLKHESRPSRFNANGEVATEENTAIEHFGFVDGISNPPIAGLSDRPDYVVGAGKLDEAGRWQPLAAGEFLLGHADEADQVGGGDFGQDGFALNGSYLVIRKLAQDVEGFEADVMQYAKRHQIQPDEMAARLMGRYYNGDPLVTGTGRNNFTFAQDPSGSQCPLGSHVRISNPRDTFSEIGKRTPDRHRILRRGITYGPEDGERGLWFLGLNANIERQFELIQCAWINDDNRNGGRLDPIVGAHDGQQIVRVSRTNSSQIMSCPDFPAFVTTRGGGYFFLPGLRALEALIGGEMDD